MRGLPLPFFGAGSFFCFLVDGGVVDKSEASFWDSTSSSLFSESSNSAARFFDATLEGLIVVCFFAAAALGAAFGLAVAGFFGAGLAF